MILSSIGMIFLVRGGSTGFTWLMVAIFVMANILAILVR
jgi:hypothetical protein